MKVKFIFKEVNQEDITSMQYDILQVISNYIEANEELKEVENFIQDLEQYRCSLDKIEDLTYYINVLDYEELVFWYLGTSLMNFKKNKKKLKKF